MRVTVTAGAPQPRRTSLGPVCEARVPSSSDPGQHHTVFLYSDGSWECTCPGFRYGARADGLCRHVDQVTEERERALSLAVLLG